MMKYPIPKNVEEIMALQEEPINEEVVAAAIAGVIEIGRSQGQSLEELKAQALADDNLLDMAQRQWLSQTLEEAWQNWPESGETLKVEQS